MSAEQTAVETTTARYERAAKRFAAEAKYLRALAQLAFTEEERQKVLRSAELHRIAADSIGRVLRMMEGFRGVATILVGENGSVENSVVWNTDDASGARDYFVRCTDDFATQLAKDLPLVDRPNVAEAATA